ncbi:chitin synthase [Malassezia pachydermatis]
MRRHQSLSRPERAHQITPLINPDGEPDDPFSEHRKPPLWRMWWHYLAIVCTFWAPAPMLSLLGFHNPAVRQAWREKITLVLFACVLGAIIAYITVGLQRTLCPTDARDVFQNVKNARGLVGVLGQTYDAQSISVSEALTRKVFDTPGLDLTPYLNAQNHHFDRCNGQTGRYAQWLGCIDVNNRPAPCEGLLSNQSLQSKLHLRDHPRLLGFDWKDVAESPAKLLSIDGYVLNFESYLAYNPTPIPNDDVDEAIRAYFNETFRGADATKIFARHRASKNSIECLKQRYTTGRVNYKTSGCFVAELILYISLIVILGLVIARTVMAIWYAWVGSRRLASPPPAPGKMSQAGVKRPRPISHVQMPVDASADNPQGLAPWADKKVRQSRLIVPGKSGELTLATPELPVAMTPDDIGNDPYIVCLVTCYSEGLEGISATLSSLSTTEYPTNRKLIFVVADGMVTGFGETVSTPDICVSLMTPDQRFGTPTPMSYRSVAAGRKAHNMALVYAGHYLHPSGGAPVPMVVVVKCGLPEDANEAKPGNRGKRDSQMILMNFLQRVTYNDPMTPLDYDLFRKTHALMGVTPDYFELCLMVDADTKLQSTSLRYLANAMLNDHRIMGACGETRVQNKAQSWVTAIQVFEYFISHHQVKAFEAVFGGVTCLPGCFSMYRIKARKPGNEDWIPVIVKPEVTREYSQAVVTTLHQKNLLLLGEDRFLSTLMLRTFPHRKMVFVPQAICHTEVPHTFKMLLSQRRRWINSTVHNLMELVLVRDLCGTFCFSMQFVVLMDLIGTLVLPVAIALTYYLIIMSIIHPPRDFTSAIPLTMLVAVLFAPGFVVACIRFSFHYIVWLIIYLIFLPVWNFILPAYSFWHFDDFSWGETRKVEGEMKPTAHDIGEESYQASLNIPMRQWADWERSRIRKLARDQRRREELESRFGAGFHNDSDVPPATDANLRRVAQTVYPTSPSPSLSNEEDRWGDQIGAYNENDAVPELLRANRPVSTVLAPGGAGLVDEGDMESILREGWDGDDDDDDDGDGHGDDKDTRPDVRGPFLNAPNYSVMSLQDETDPLSDSLEPRTPVDMGTLIQPRATLAGTVVANHGASASSSSAISNARGTHARNRSMGQRMERPYE